MNSPLIARSLDLQVVVQRALVAPMVQLAGYHTGKHGSRTFRRLVGRRSILGKVRLMPAIWARRLGSPPSSGSEVSTYSPPSAMRSKFVELAESNHSFRYGDTDRRVPDNSSRTCDHQTRLVTLHVKFDFTAACPGPP